MVWFERWGGGGKQVFAPVRMCEVTASIRWKEYVHVLIVVIYVKRVTSAQFCFAGEKRIMEEITFLTAKGSVCAVVTLFPEKHVTPPPICSSGQQWLCST